MAILALAFDGRLYEHHIHALKKYSKIKNISSYGHIGPALWSEPPIRTMNCIQITTPPPCCGYKKYSNYNYIAVTAVLESESPIHYRGHYFHNFGGGLLETRTMHLVYLKYIKD